MRCLPGDTTRSLLHRARWSAVGVHGQRTGAASCSGGYMADPPGLRLGEPGLAPLVGGSRSRQHARSVRRTRVRTLGPRGRGPLGGRLGRRPRECRRCGRDRRLLAPRNLSGRGDRTRLRGASSRARLAPGSLRWLRTRCALASGHRPTTRGSVDLGDPRRLGGPEPGVSSPVHDVVPSERNDAADGMVRRTSATLDLRRDRRASLRGTRQHRCRRASRRTSR